MVINMTSLTDYFWSILPEGINLILDSAKETGVEITTLYIANQLNKMKWAGKGDWSDDVIESFINNYRGNLQSSITANIVQRRIAKIQVDNAGYYVTEKGKQYLQAFMNRRGV